MRVLDTPHYRIHTDLEAKLAENLATRMEAMYDQFTRRLVDFAPAAGDRFEVYLFANRADYTRLTADRFPNTGGIFIARRNLLAAFLEGQGRDGLRRTLQHEGFHQFAYTCISPNLPVWLNEGIAQVFEEGLWTGRQFVIGQVPPRRVRQLLADLQNRRFMPFAQFMTLNDEQWHEDLRDRATAAARYDQAWAMVHFLVFANDNNGQPKYRARFVELLKLIRAGHKPDEAFVSAFSDNIDGFQDRFLEFARALRPTGEAMLIEHQTVLADMLVTLGSQGHSFDDIDVFRKFLIDGGYRLRYTRGDTTWSTDEDPRAYFRDTTGRLMTREQLTFSPRGGAPLPDIICQPADRLQLRTIFHQERDRIDYETLIETQ